MTSSLTRLITRHESEAPFLEISREFKTARTERLQAVSFLKESATQTERGDFET
jgi:hypothetical protein